MIVEVEREERYWYPDEGGIVWLAGFQPVLPDGRYLGREAPELAAAGLRIAGVAGAARFHGEALASHAAEPGRPLELRRDPDNPHDPNAIAVHAGGAQVGWVPRAVAEEIAPAIDAGEPYAAIVLREQRASPRDPRTGLTMLLARTSTCSMSGGPANSSGCSPSAGGSVGARTPSTASTAPSPSRNGSMSAAFSPPRA